MSSIILSASVRQNLLSLQSTADLLATTQNRLATGKKVNTALDNPSNFFTAASLDNRASDISNLLDGIGNGVQVLQAANTGITSLQGLVDSAKSVANQALQAAVGYSAKSSVTSAAITGATVDDLRGTGGIAGNNTVAGSALTNDHTAVLSNNTVQGSALNDNHLGAYQSATDLGSAVHANTLSAYTNAAEVGTQALSDTSSALISASTSLDHTTGLDLSSLDGEKLTINGKNITFDDSATGITGSAGAGFTIGTNASSTLTVQDILSSIDAITGTSTPSTVNGGGHIVLNTGTAADISTTGSDAGVLSFFGLGDQARGGGTATNPVVTSATKLVGAASPSSNALSTSITNGSVLSINSKTITFSTAQTTSTVDGSGNYTIGIGSGSTLAISDVLSAIDNITGAGTGASTVDVNGKLNIASGTSADLVIGTGSGNALTALGLTAGTTPRTNATATPAAITGSTLLSGAASPTSDSLASAFTTSDTIVVNGTTINFTAAGSGTQDATHVRIDDSLSSLLGKIDTITGAATASTVTGGKVTLSTGTAADLVTSGSGLAKLGLTAGTTARTAATVTPANITGATLLSGTASPTSNDLSSAFTTSDTIVVNGTTINFTAAGSGTQDATHVRIDDSVSSLLGKIDAITGATTASTVTAGKVTLSTGTAADLVTSGSGLAKLGLSAGTTARTPGVGSLDGQILTIAATGNGTATNITFGDGTGGTVKSLNDLNNALSANNLQASLSSSGALTISTTNDAASSTIGTIAGSAAATGAAFHGLTASAPVQDPSALSVRANLVSQYNNILDQITTTAQDASFNGIGLINGDQLKLTFNETGTSTLKINGVTFNATGLNLSKLTAGTDFLDNASANNTLKALGSASNSLRTEASVLGSNLSIVQIRQDFSKNLINVLQTGSSNLTLADTNEEAANSQALSTRQSIAVSALALANQSQQSVLQLLR